MKDQPLIQPSNKTEESVSKEDFVIRVFFILDLGSSE